MSKKKLKTNENIDCGLAEINEADLQKLKDLGFAFVPMSLVALVGYLDADYQSSATTLTDVLNDEKLFAKFRQYDAKTGSMFLIEKQYQSLNAEERVILKAISIFRQAIEFPILEIILRERLKPADILETLSRNTLVRRIGANVYELLPQAKEVIAAQADKQDESLTRREMHVRAADYYLSARNPLAECQMVADFNCHFEEIHHAFEAEDYNRAATVLDQKTGEFLQGAGYSALILKECEKLVGKPMSKGKSAYFFGWMSLVYQAMNRVDEALDFNKKSISLYRKLNSQMNVGIMTNALGSAYFAQGESKKAIRNYYRALRIVQAQSQKQPETECNILSNLGNAYLAEKNTTKALDFYQQTFSLAEENNINRYIAYALSGKGEVYLKLSEYEKAKNFLEEGIVILKKERRDLGIAYIEAALGMTKFRLGEKDEGKKLIEKARQFAVEADDKRLEKKCLEYLGEIKK